MSRKTLYEISFAVLALFAVVLATADILSKIPLEYQTLYVIIDRIILAIFAIDYFTRLYLAKDKKKYFKENIFELLSIIPLDSFFRGFRIFRVIRIVRVMFLTKRLSSRANSFLNTNGFIYILLITISTILTGSVIIYYLEKDITMKTFGDELWWSFVTVTTVGYGDLSPATGAGRITAAILMIVGIGFIGMLTGTIATYFIKKVKSPKVHDENQILNLSGLDKVKFEMIREYSEYIQNK